MYHTALEAAAKSPRVVILNFVLIHSDICVLLEFILFVAKSTVSSHNTTEDNASLPSLIGNGVGDNPGRAWYFCSMENRTRHGCKVIVIVVLIKI